MKRGLKIRLIIFGVILTGTLIFTLINIKSIFLAFGNGKLDVKSFDEAQSIFEQSELYGGTQVHNENNVNIKTITGSTQDGVVDLTIQGEADGKIAKVDAKIHGGMLKDIDPTDINALTQKAKTYLSPIIPDDEVLGLSGFVAKEAIEQYRQGNTDILIQQDFEGVHVSIKGDINTREFTAEIITKP
jgi:hypothetical protein